MLDCQEDWRTSQHKYSEEFWMWVKKQNSKSPFKNLKDLSQVSVEESKRLPEISMESSVNITKL